VEAISELQGRRGITEGGGKYESTSASKSIQWWKFDICTQIYVDRKAQTILLPVHGFAAPFHINTIKNASKNDEGDFTYLRINFQTPGQLAGKKEDAVRLELLI